MKYRNEFIEALKAKGYDGKTVVEYRRYLDCFIEYTKERCIQTTDDITPAFLEEYQRYILTLRNRWTKERLTLRHIGVRLRAVKQYFRYLVEHKHILIDPTIHLSIPRLPEYLPRNILQEDEIKQLLNVPDISATVGIRDRAIMEVLYSTGIRGQELVNLNLYDIDTREGILRVNQGKNRKDRVVPLGKIACYWINEYIKKMRNPCVKTSQEQALFIARNGSRLKKGTLRYTINKYAKKIFPGRQISCHGFRHSCATHMLHGGANIRIIQQMLGHSSIKTTQIYTKVSPIDLKAVHKRYHPSDRRRKEKERFK
jgi:integrase/recombinase XerD